MYTKLSIKYFIKIFLHINPTLIYSGKSVDTFYKVTNSANIYLFKVNKRNTTKSCEVCSKFEI